nr:hypothetical protein [Candidatus Cloacimonadota bacterium]
MLLFQALSKVDMPPPVSYKAIPDYCNSLLIELETKLDIVWGFQFSQEPTIKRLEDVYQNQ